MRWKEARSRSSLVMITARGMPSSEAARHISSVPTSTPSTAETTKRARSAARSAALASPEKSAYPGASMTLMRCPRQSAEATASPREIFRSCSSGSASKIEVPWSTEPWRFVAPAA